MKTAQREKVAAVVLTGDQDEQLVRSDDAAHRAQDGRVENLADALQQRRDLGLGLGALVPRTQQLDVFALVLQCYRLAGAARAQLVRG